MKVIVVEDDDSMREAIERLLGAAGIACTAFTSAEAMLADAAAGVAACVVSDFKLPSKSGLDLLAELRARHSCPPLILITAHDAPGLRDEALQRGAADYLVKPFRGTALLASIKAATAAAGTR
jgi:FixJ family two-component response regulator